MRKSTVFISIVLTTFMMVILYGVVSAYQGTPSLSVQEAATNTAQPTEIVDLAPTPLTPEQAALLAAQVLGHDDLQSAESSNLNGVNAYKITFLSGDVVYVGLDGQILSIQTAPQIVTIVQPANQSGGGNNGGNGGNNGGGNNRSNNEHEDGGD